MAPVTRAFVDAASSTVAARDMVDGVASALSHSVRDTAASLHAHLQARNRLFARQSQNEPVEGIIPTFYQLGGPAPGAVVGIVLGSVAGFLLIVWLIQTIMNQNPSNQISGQEEIVIRRKDRSPRSRRSRRSQSTRNVEVRQVSRSPRRVHSIVDDRRGPAVPPPPRSPRRSRSIVVEERYEERRVPGDDIVEVIEEGTNSDITPPPRRQRSNRGSRYR